MVRSLSLPLLLLIVLGAAGSAFAADTGPSMQFTGTGDQVYICSASGTQFAWTLKAPDAILTEGKDVVGKPVLYKTTPEFLLQFGLKDLKELPTLKEFEELRRLAMDDDLMPIAEAKGPQQAPEEVIVEPLVESAESA